MVCRMKKLLLCVLLCTLLAPSVSAAGTQTYDLPEIGLTVEIPEQFLVTTRSDAADSDPTLLSNMLWANRYLELFDNDNYTMLCVYAESSYVADLNDMSDTEFASFLKRLRVESGVNKAETFDTSSYYQELICRGWFLPPNTYDCGSFVVNGTAVVGKEQKSLITAANQHKRELNFMKSIFEEMGGTYRQEGDYLIPNLALPDELEYQIGKYGRMRRSYLKEHRPVLYANLLTSGMLHRHLAEIDQACNERMEIIVSAMAKREDVTETLKASDQMEWVRRMNSIRSRAEEIVLTELVYE